MNEARGRIARRVVAVAAALTLVAGAGSAFASAANDERDTRAIEPRLTGSTTGANCMTGFDTQSSTLVPPDDSTSDNAPAGSVTVLKKCAGAVIATLTAEVSAANAGDFIHLDMRATCVAAGGQTDPCTPGQQVFASPGHTFLQNGGGSGTATRSSQMVWSGLKKGRWLFEALPGGNASANLQFRTFRVDMYFGG